MSTTKQALVTGGTSGIGQAIARCFVLKGRWFYLEHDWMAEEVGLGADYVETFIR